MSTEKEDDIKVIEEKDGSALVEMPEGMAPEPDEQEDEPVAEEQKAEGGEADDGDEDRPGDSDAMREARRARRKAKKEFIKRTNEERQQKLEFLARQNQELMARLAAIEKKSHVSDLAKIDGHIRDEEMRLNYAKMKMKEAADNSDGQALIKAQELWHESRDKLEKMKMLKQRVEAAPPEPPTDAAVKEYATSWMDRNPWYDPDGKDPESRMAKRIDNQLVKEGWDPSTEEYWEELDARLQEQKPSRYTESNSETPRKRGPRSVVTGSERETGGGASRNTYTLTPEQVSAIKEAGFWDDLKMRAKMAKKYAEYQQRSNRS